MDNLIRFNGFVFNSKIGELIHLDGSGNETVSRLQPQPSKLLKLLLENYPNVVSRDQIRKSIWPDVQVDFDGSMHFCIRQIRSALDDQAADPKFIETIPRRGYRWIADIKGNGDIVINGIDQLPVSKWRVENNISNGVPPTPIKSKYKRFWLFGLIGLAISTSLLYFFFIKLEAPNALPNSPKKIRIAIMPFQPDDEDNAFAGNDIAYQLVETLTNQFRSRFDIIGPTTTSTIDPKKIFDFADEYRIDYFINDRFLKQENESRLLGELIRASDGAHVWVQSFEAGVDWDSIYLEIQQGVVGYLMVGNNEGE